MALQILPPDAVLETGNKFDSELLVVIFSLALLVFLTIKISKNLSKMDKIKKLRLPNLSSFLVIFFLR
jgi:hypothetical protein